MKTAKECSDEAETNCLLPLTFNYQDGQVGVTTGAGSAPAGSSNGLYVGRYDLNGDGKNDIAYKNGTTWYVAFGSNTGFSGPYSVGITSSIVIDKFLPNGRDSMLTLIGGTIWSYRWDDATSAFVGYNTGVASTILGTPIDYNGDGVADLINKNSNGLNLQVRVNTSSASSSNPSFASSLLATATVPAGYKYGGVIAYTGKGLSHADLNGDGREDLIVLMIKQDETSQLVTFIALGSSSGLTVPPSSTWQYDGFYDWPWINFNGDACTDRINGSIVNISACNGQFASTVVIPATPVQLLDWDGDGKTDLLVNNGGFFGVYKSTGTGVSGLTTTSISSAGTFFDTDLDDDHLDDLVKINGTAAFSYWTHTLGGAVPTYATNIPDLMTSVVDGFGVTSSPSYVSTASFQYTIGAATNYPLQEAPPAIVVAQVSSSDGIGSTYTATYSYSGARVNVLRGTHAGFQRVDSSDSRRGGLVVREYFEQQFPLTGMVSQVELMQANGVTPISRQVNTNSFTMLDSTANNQRYFAYPAGSTSTQYEFGGTWNGNLIRTVTTANSFENTGGTLYDQVVTTSEPASGANGVTAGGSWTARTYAPPANLMNDATNWCLGRPGQVQQISSHNLTNYGAQITRTTNTTWNASFCRPTQTVAEPGSGTLQVTTDIGYDSFGNVNSTVVTGTGMEPRSTTASYSDATYTTGQFLLSETRAVSAAFSQISTVAWNYDLGVPSSATDPNSLTTSWQYDAFGRRIREDHPDGTYATIVFSSCPCGSNPNNRYYTVEAARDSGGNLFNVVYRYFDTFDRQLTQNTQKADGATYVYNRRDFDALGNVVAEYFPRDSSAPSNGYSTIAYDFLDRPVQISRPISDSNATLQSSNVYYEGLSTRIVDPQSKQTTRILNAVGQLVRSSDHDSYFQAFEFDAFGNPKRVMDSASNTLQTSTYNLRGMLTQRVDMDMGTWNFTPDALGETMSQTDARNKTTNYEFDRLGRLKKRTEEEGVSNFTFGISNSAKNIGQLASIDGPGYSETYTYDSIGRRSSTLVSADATYQIDYAYNAIGALDTLTYPASTGTNPLKLKYEYQNGYLTAIKECAAPACTTYGTTYWHADSFNARNQVTQETLGNNLVSNRVFDAVSGWQKSIQTGSGAGIQNLAYEWDLVGNLKKRKDLNQSTLTEEFFYDNLYRLDYSQLNGVVNLDMTYDAMGNITNKSDVGTYTYNATKKHQLTSTSNGWSFSYDNDGNMLTGRGATIDWASFNYPSSIANGSLSSQFSYTPYRQYWKQVAQYSDGQATTYYIGGLLEKVVTSAGTDYRHMIVAGGARIIVSRRSDGQDATWYSLGDSLGSNSTVTTSGGAVQVALSYATFGSRRGSNWQGTPSGGDWTNIASTSRRGFTDHTMLDNVNLIHMNGRIYDPMLGRMMSADPTIPGSSTQAFNRYSYVNNNPVSMTDPSGFSPATLGTRANRRDGDDSEISWTQELAMFRNAANFQITPDMLKPNDFNGAQTFMARFMSGFRGSDGGRPSVRSAVDTRAVLAGRAMQWIPYTGKTSSILDMSNGGEFFFPYTGHWGLGPAGLSSSTSVLTTLLRMSGLSAPKSRSSGAVVSVNQGASEPSWVAKLSCSRVGRSTIRGTVSGGVYGLIQGKGKWQGALLGAGAGGILGFAEEKYRDRFTDMQFFVATTALAATISMASGDSPITSMVGGMAEAANSGSDGFTETGKATSSVVIGASLEALGKRSPVVGGVAGIASFTAGELTGVALDAMCD